MARTKKSALDKPTSNVGRRAPSLSKPSPSSDKGLSKKSGKTSAKSSKVIPPHPVRASLPGLKRADRLRPGTAALREIRRAQKSTALLIPKTNFSRVAREIGEELKPGTRWTANGLEALQEAAEDYLVKLMEDANVSAIHRNSVTISSRDIRHVRLLRKEE
jgi:histone H3/H4